MDVNAASTNGRVSSSVMPYSYPTQTVTLNCLNSSTTYNYCVIATNTTNMVQIGEPVCGSFTTRRITSENNEGTYVPVMYAVTHVHAYKYVSTYLEFRYKIDAYVCDSGNLSKN